MPEADQPIGRGSGRGRREILLCIAGSALYGAVLGSWNGPRMALYAAIKLPLLLLGTALLTTPFSALVARAFGLALSLTQSALLAVRALAHAALLLAALAPVAALFTWAAPPPDPTARTAHNVLYLAHTALIGACGLAGVRHLRGHLHAAAPGPRSARSTLIAWVAVFALVAGELAWALRPFVGSIFEPIALIREDALDGNVYEFVWTDIRPHLLKRLSTGGNR